MTIIPSVAKFFPRKNANELQVHSRNGEWIRLKEWIKKKWKKNVRNHRYLVPVVDSRQYVTRSLWNKIRIFKVEIEEKMRKWNIYKKRTLQILSKLQRWRSDRVPYSTACIELQAHLSEPCHKLLWWKQDTELVVRVVLDPHNVNRCKQNQVTDLQKKNWRFELNPQLKEQKKRLRKWTKSMR